MTTAETESKVLTDWKQVLKERFLPKWSAETLQSAFQWTEVIGLVPTYLSPEYDADACCVVLLCLIDALYNPESTGVSSTRVVDELGVGEALVWFDNVSVKWTFNLLNTEFRAELQRRSEDP